MKKNNKKSNDGPKKSKLNRVPSIEEINGIRELVGFPPIDLDQYNNLYKK
jgi:hypothetical protein